MKLFTILYMLGRSLFCWWTPRIIVRWYVGDSKPTIAYRSVIVGAQSGHIMASDKAALLWAGASEESIAMCLQLIKNWGDEPAVVSLWATVPAI